MEWFQISVFDTIQSALQAPFFHYVMEGLLLLWVIRLLFFTKKKSRGKDLPNEKERMELLKEFTPEPLVPPLEKTLAEFKPCHKVVGRPGKQINIDGHKCKNFASLNFLGLLGNPRIAKEMEKIIRKYGVSSCGARGFYGTTDVHLALEDKMSELLGAEKALIYPYGFCTVSSVIPAYAKRGDVIFADEAVCMAIQNGLQTSKSKIVYFKHNDLNDLEQKMKEQQDIERKNSKKVVRKFMVVEGIYMNTGNLCDLPRLVELKFKYKVRLIVEESLSFGVLGANGKGITEYYNIPISKIDFTVGSFEYAFASTGGFCCGRTYLMEHQLILSMGFVFTTSPPTMLVRATHVGLDILGENPDLLTRMRKNARCFQERLKSIAALEVTGYSESPSFHIRRKNPESLEANEKFLQAIVNKCMENGICLIIAQRMKEDATIKNWPTSIRIAVTAEMSDDDLAEAGDVIEKAVAETLEEEVM